ncbi:transposase [Mesorhizobium sp. AaZ16]|uniref:transposase n=1 Tax=Mesorhizobium sp. AaZ16 TaxID=3402289 RepID=UPI00374ED552
MGDEGERGDGSDAGGRAQDGERGGGGGVGFGDGACDDRLDGRDALGEAGDGRLDVGDDVGIEGFAEMPGLAAEAGIASTRRNPVQTRRFAEAGGLLAKTDKLDARMLSDYGRRFTPAPDQPPCRQRERIAALARRRDQLVEARAREARHLGEAFDPDVIADIEAAVACLAKRIATIEAVIASAIAEADAATAATFAILRSAPGVGPVTALTLIAHLPELGGRSPKTIASLAGLAPRNNDSGTRRGRRPIRGGRPRVRKALYMAALGAIRAAPRFKAFYSAIAARSGSRKLAVIAAARKLLTILNAMQRDQKAYA